MDYITKNPTTLDIDEAFYAAHLSTPQQIQATAINRDLVTIVEEISSNWMRVIEKTLIQGQVIGRRVRTTGPIDEFDHWLQIYSMYSIAQELIATQKFKNHYECLEISGSKLVHVKNGKYFAMKNRLTNMYLKYVVLEMEGHCTSPGNSKQ